MNRFDGSRSIITKKKKKEEDYSQNVKNCFQFPSSLKKTEESVPCTHPRGAEGKSLSWKNYLPPRYNIYEAMHHGPTMAHNTLEEEKGAPAYPYRGGEGQRRSACVPRVRRTRTRREHPEYPGALSYRRPADNSYLSEPVFLRRGAGTGTECRPPVSYRGRRGRGREVSFAFSPRRESIQ